VHHTERVGQRVRRAVFAGVFAAVAIGATVAAADEPDAEIAAAFSKGAGDGSALRLELEFHGRTAVLRGASTADDGTRLALVCALCTRGELLARSRELGAALAAARANTRSSSLEVVGAPADAEVRIDGVPGRTGGRAQPMEAGRHAMTVSAQGGSRTSAFVLDPGESLRAAWDEMPEDRSKPRPLRVALAAGGAGLAMAAAGTALLLLDGDCATTRLNSDGECGALHDLAPLGWSLVGTGVAAVLFGVLYGAVAAHREARARKRSDGGAP
jgi:hypothetical protein